MKEDLRFILEFGTRLNSSGIAACSGEL